MKAAAFDYARAATLAEAAGSGARLMAGGQSLGPMLNLRLARPERVVDIRRLPALRFVRETAEGASWGAATTHAEIEDGVAPDPTGGFLRGVARTIAYRAVRNRGTVGGSLCHADPAADWPGALSLAGAVAETSAGRRIPVAALIRGPFETVLAENELLLSVQIPRPPAGTRFGRHKVVRKTGEFAQAIAGVAQGPGLLRAMLGAVDGPPLLFEGPAALTAARDAIAGLGGLPPHRRAMLAASLERAAAEAGL
jgi:aerobic carbon-monoxide dehydrogenase medium subunit